jgi:biopolymer transport protein TolR
MAATVSRRGSRRRAVAEINMVPFIDVMLVLLIIFMVTAPLLTPGLVELPSVGRAAQQADRVVEVIIKSDERLLVKAKDQDASAATATQMAKLAQTVKATQRDANSPIVISADKSVRYELVVKVLDTLKRAGFSRVALAVRTES